MNKQLLYCIPCQGNNLFQKFSSTLNPVGLRKQAATLILGLRKKCGLILMEKSDEVVFLFKTATLFFGHVLFSLNAPFPLSILGNFAYHKTRKNVLFTGEPVPNIFSNALS